MVGTSRPKRRSGARGVVSIKDIGDYALRPAPLRRLSRGRARLAALALVGAHLAVLTILLLIWLVGLAPIFNGVHWIPAVLASVFLIVGVIATFLAFAPWANQYEVQFSLGTAIVLGWLHWQMLMTTLVVGGLGVALIWADVRWHHVFATPEMEGLRDRAVTMPIPQDWSLESAGESNNGFPADFYEYEQSFDVPQSYRFPQLVEWMSSPEWASSFGALQEVDCDVELERCEAEVVPAPGEEVTQFVEASYRASSIGGLPPMVKVDLQYPIPE